MKHNDYYYILVDWEGYKRRVQGQYKGTVRRWLFFKRHKFLVEINIHDRDFDTRYTSYKYFYVTDEDIETQ